MTILYSNGRPKDIKVVNKEQEDEHKWFRIVLIS